MSTFINPVSPVVAESASNPAGGSTTSATADQKIAVTSDEGTVIINASEVPDTGEFEISSATTGADIAVNGTGTAQVNIGIAVDADGNVLSSAGTTYQIADDYEGDAKVNLDGSIISGGTVDLTTATPEGSSIADNAPKGTSDIDIYVKTGAGNDQVKGTIGNDFIRLGAGNDEFDAGKGDDIVRLGTGDDSGFLSGGDDVVYLTVDQLVGVNNNTLKDFDLDGNDKIQIDAAIEGRVEIEGVGTNGIVITLSGSETGVTAIISEGESIDEDDIEFV